jgi:flap endonuclease-1
MGIKKLYDIIRKFAPNSLEEIHISEYSYKKVAIDVSLYMFKYKAIAGNYWLNSFLKLVCCLRKNDIHSVFIFDTSAPPEKEIERAERREAKEKLEQQVYELEESYNNYEKTGEINNILKDLYYKVLAKEKPTLLIDKSNLPIDMKVVKNKIEHKKSQIINISPQDFELTKKLFDILAVPYYNAPMEAENMCADLCKRGLVNAVLTEDTDVLAYASPIFLSKIDTNSETCTRINYNNLLNELNMSSEQFLDLCIMCGCDYNETIPKIGPMTAYKHIIKYQNIENFAQSTKTNINCLNHNRVRQLFTDYPQHPVEKIPFCGKPNFDNLEQLINEYNMNINLQKITNVFTVQNKVVFIEEEEEEEIIIEDE